MLHPTSPDYVRPTEKLSRFRQLRQALLSRAPYVSIGGTPRGRQPLIFDPRLIHSTGLFEHAGQRQTRLVEIRPEHKRTLELLDRTARLLARGEHDRIPGVGIGVGGLLIDHLLIVGCRFVEPPRSVRRPARNSLARE